MCGICGWVAFDRDLQAPESRRELAKMTATMALRGPDDEGTFIAGPVALGHRRLAIIDLESGRQPMILKSDNQPALVLVYSGETYNYRELRERLVSLGHRFETNSDTEVVLRAHCEWGRLDPRKPVSELNGMFAYALWDVGRQELLLVRDRLGIKPLYYYPTERGVLFGSEPKAILANGLAKRTLDVDGLRRALGDVADPESAVFSGMREVPPGRVVRVTRDGIQQQTYWQLSDTAHSDNVPQTVRHIRELLEDTVRRQLISDVLLCTLLSGGLDSSALTALAALFNNEPIRSFSVDFVGYTDNFTPDKTRITPDGPYAREAAEFIGSNHSRITLSADELMSTVVRAATLRARDLPLTGGNCDSSLYLLFQAIRKHSTVALTGESADEIFGGYHWFHEPIFAAANTFPWWVGRERIDTEFGFFDPELLMKLDMPGYIEDQYRKALAEVPTITGPSAADPREQRMRELSYISLTRFLPLLLERQDRLSMALGLEVRVPFCDHRLVQYVFGTPWSHKTFDGREKSLLRAATAGLLPQSITHRIKSAYPAIRDLAYDKMLRTEFIDLLNNNNAAVAPLLACGRDHIGRNMDQRSRTMANRREMEQLLTFNDFLTTYNVSLAI